MTSLQSYWILTDITLLDSVPLELPLINGAVIFVPGKAVRLIDDYRLELLALGISDKPLELRSLVCAA